MFQTNAKVVNKRDFCRTCTLEQSSRTIGCQTRMENLRLNFMQSNSFDKMISEFICSFPSREV